MSETSKYRHLTSTYCYRADGQPGCGIDIGSQGDPVVPWAWQFDLPDVLYRIYNGADNGLRAPVNLRGEGDNLIAIDDASLDFVYSSHLLEDYADWTPPLTEWVRVLKPGGYLIILVPDRERWLAALRRGQPPNSAHKHEGHVGELSLYAQRLHLEVIEDRLTDLSPEDYSILFIAKKL